MKCRNSKSFSLIKIVIFVALIKDLFMKAKVQYNDFIGTAAADVADYGGTNKDNFEDIASFVKLDLERFKLVGISIYGVRDFSFSLICVDKEKSKPNKEHIVSMSINENIEKDFLRNIFKRFNVILYEKFDDQYPSLDISEEVNYQDFH
jgi:hypothetical protein